MSESDHAAHSPYPATRLAPHGKLVSPALVWGALGVMLAWALTELFFLGSRGHLRDDVTAILLLAGAAGGLIFAVGRVRGRTRMADAFFPLVLLNPILFRHARQMDPLDTSLIACGLLGLMAAAIVAMRRDNLLRYFIVTAMALGLAALSKSFLMLMPALVGWLIYMGYGLAKSSVAKERVRGFVVMAFGEVMLLFFGIACLLEEPAAAPAASTLFGTIVGFADFPLIVVAIVMLALGWRAGPQGKAPPYFWGMLALLVGLLTLLLNDFQFGKLPAPGADQTVLELCVLYVVFALHGPRRLQWIAPPLLLLAAAGYTFLG